MHEYVCTGKSQFERRIDSVTFAKVNYELVSRPSVQAAHDHEWLWLNETEALI